MSMRSSPTVSPRRKWTVAAPPAVKVKVGSPMHGSVATPGGTLRGQDLSLGSPFSTRPVSGARGEDGRKLGRRSSLSPTVAASMATFSTARRRYRFKLHTLALCIAFVSAPAGTPALHQAGEQRLSGRCLGQ